MTNPDYDPFAPKEKVPSVSFKGSVVGDVRTIVTTEYSTVTQSTDFESGELAFWDDGKPKMSAVLKGESLEGEPLALWADIPSALLKAVSDAQEAVSEKYRATPGDRIDIQHYADKPNSNPRLNAQKLYRAKITVGFRVPTPAAPVDDPWASTPATAPAQSGFDDEPPF